MSSSETHYDAVIETIADYVLGDTHFSDEALSTAAFCLLDSLGCALLALSYPACTKLLGPLVEGATLAGGCRIPACPWELDPVQAAFNIGTMVRWLDYNDTWLAAEWGHPSDNLGALLAVSDYLGRKMATPVYLRDLLVAMIQAHEVQGVLALDNSFNRVGIDHVILVRVASAAVATRLLGGNKEQVCAAISQAWVDGGSLRCYRHFPNTGSRKSWAAGDASARGVSLALMALREEMGYPTALTCQTWGFQEAFFRSQDVGLQRELGCYVMENVLFKVSFPAEFHAQTAVEAAVQLHRQLKGKIGEIERIDIHTHESAIRIIDKTGPLKNPADRDHCIQYMVAIALLHGDLRAEHYEESAAQDPAIDRLREMMVLHEEAQYSKDYLDPDKRSIANTLTVRLQDGCTLSATVEYPLGHRLRRQEAKPKIIEKFHSNASSALSTSAVKELLELFSDQRLLEKTSVETLMGLLSI